MGCKHLNKKRINVFSSQCKNRFPIFFQHGNMGHDARKHANIKGADQLAHPHSMISAFYIGSKECIIAKLASYKFSTFQLATVAEQACLCLIWLETRRTDFLEMWPIFINDHISDINREFKHLGRMKNGQLGWIYCL